MKGHFMDSYKPFSQLLCDQNDGVAKKVAIDFLVATGVYELTTPLEKQSEQYKKWDFVIHNNKKDQDETVEVEVKRVWTRQGCWQGFPTIDVPKRKSKSKADIFIMVNSSADTIATTRMEKILNSPVGFKKTIYTKNEPFFNVHLDDFKFYQKRNGKWYKVSP
jgi:hypothetical protein